ncbi:hypothetical protein HYY75_02640, partial [bacterium]|nr:hypothetical protein [bacterium]
IMAKDDEGLTGLVEERTRKGLESGNLTPSDRLLAAKVALLQGEFFDSLMHFVKAASQDDSQKKNAEEGFIKILNSGHYEFILKPPDVISFFQAYVFEDQEDRLYLSAQFRPPSPIFVVPFILSLEGNAVKSVENLSKDILFAMPDPNLSGTETFRLWVAGKNIGDEVPIFELKAILHLDSSKTNYLDLSNFITSPEVTDNWSAVVGASESFSISFAAPNYDREENGVLVKGYQLSLSDGKGPMLSLNSFRKPLPQKIDIWKTIGEIRNPTQKPDN